MPELPANDNAFEFPEGWSHGGPVRGRSDRRAAGLGQARRLAPKVRIEGDLLHIETSAEFSDVILDCSEVDNVALGRDDMLFFFPSRERNGVAVCTLVEVFRGAEEPRSNVIPFPGTAQRRDDRRRN